MNKRGMLGGRLLRTLADKTKFPHAASLEKIFVCVYKIENWHYNNLEANLQKEE